jgi:glycosyltransferase involved in cell wall biosynthesis
MRDDISFVVHSYNEAEALRLLITSSLPIANTFSEWVVLDHRSNDHTQTMLDDLEPLLAERDVQLTRAYEPRDLSAECTFAHVRTATIKAATRPVVALMDADFILGVNFPQFLHEAHKHLTAPGSTTYGFKYQIPVIWDFFTTDDTGIVQNHGRVWKHDHSDRILYRDAVHYTQTGACGRWEKIQPSPERPQFHLLNNDDGNAILSINVKPAERINLRYTMTYFMEDAMQGTLTGDWLDNYTNKRTRRMPDYPWDPTLNYRGAHTLIRNLKMQNEHRATLKP